MDLKKVITDIVEKLKGNKDLLNSFNINPLETVKKLAGNLDESVIQKIVPAIKNVLAGGKIDEVVSGLISDGEKLLSDAKEEGSKIVEKIEDKVEDAKEDGLVDNIKDKISDGLSALKKLF